MQEIVRYNSQCFQASEGENLPNPGCRTLLNPGSSRSDESFIAVQKPKNEWHLSNRRTHSPEVIRKEIQAARPGLSRI
jgi:hypothetical protein